MVINVFPLFSPLERAAFDEAQVLSRAEKLSFSLKKQSLFCILLVSFHDPKVNVGWRCQPRLCVCVLHGVVVCGLLIIY
jgi:hypothetical protein